MCHVSSLSPYFISSKLWESQPKDASVIPSPSSVSVYYHSSIFKQKNSNEWTPNKSNTIGSSKHQGSKRQGFVARFPSIQIGRLNPSFSTHLTDYTTSTNAVLVLLQNNLLLSVVQFVAVNHHYTFFCKEGYCGHIGYLRLCGIQNSTDIQHTNSSNSYYLSEKKVYPTNHTQFNSQPSHQTNFD